MTASLDRLKRDKRLDTFDENAGSLLGFAEPEDTGRLDDTLALMFVACHPALGKRHDGSRDAQQRQQAPRSDG